MKITQIVGSNNKALNIQEGNKNTLQSYSTKICTVNKGKVQLHKEYKEYLKDNKHSLTTSKHVKLFSALHGVEINKNLFKN